VWEVLLIDGSVQVWTSRIHDCDDGCICTMEEDEDGEEEFVWNPECTITGHTGEVFSVAFSPDGKRVVSGSYDKLAKIWDAETGTEVSWCVGVRACVQCVW
jgi:WD40 repeat protein